LGKIWRRRNSAFEALDMKTKYKFIETTGCTAFDFTVNSKSFSELSQQEYNEMLDYLFVKIREGINEQTILLENVIQLFQYDDYEYDPLGIFKYA
jgi:hypothetical protein